MNNIRISTAQEWEKKINENNGSVFHLYEWGKLMEKLPDVTFYPTQLNMGDKEIYLPLFEQNGKLSASLLGYGGPIISGNGKVDFEEIQKYIFAEYKKYISNLLIPYNSNPFYTYKLSKWQGKPTYILKLPELYNELWDNCSGKARTSVRYSLKHRVEVKRLNKEDLHKFYNLYLEHSETVNSSYIIKYDLFAYCFEKLEGNSIFLGAYKDGDLVSSSIYLQDNYAMYYWININSNEGKKLQASYLIMNFALKFAIEDNLKVMDFGYSHTKEIAKPKLYWGATIEKTPILKSGRGD